MPIELLKFSRLLVLKAITVFKSLLQSEFSIFYQLDCSPAPTCQLANKTPIGLEAAMSTTLFFWHERSSFQLVGVRAVDWQQR